MTDQAQRARDAPKRKQVRGAAVRERFVDVASALFYHHGIHAVGIDEVVRRTGMAKASLYRWFTTKDDLILAVLERRDQQFWAEWDHAAAAHDDVRDQLDAQFAWIQDRATSAGYRGCAFVNAAAEFGDISHHTIRTRCEQHEDKLQRRLLALTCRLGIDHGEQLADRLHLAIVGALVVGGLYPAGPAAELRSFASDLIATAIKADRSLLD